MGEWCKKTREYYLSELKTNHDYEAYSAVLTLSRYAVLLGILEVEQANKELSDAITFKLYFESENKNGDESYMFSGEIPISLDLNDFTLSGAGIGHYDSFEYSSAFETWQYLGPSDFNVNAKLDVFKPCENSLDILVVRFGSLQESFLITDSDGKTTKDIYNNELNPQDSTVHTELVAAFYDKQDEGYFRFHLNLTNLSADAADQTFKKDWEFGDYASIHFKLVHEPK